MNTGMAESVQPLCELRSQIARIEGRRALSAARPAGLGVDSLDRALGGGLARGCLHELLAAGPDGGAAATGFATILSMLALPAAAPTVWLRTHDMRQRVGLLHPHGLAAIGFDPARLLLVETGDPVALLRAAADVVRCPAVGAAVIELWGTPRALDLTATRRLGLAAQDSGVTILLLRIAAEPQPSTAQTRWSVATAPSTPLEADAPGHPAFDVTLLRQRGRPDGGRWRLEWDRERRHFHGAAFPGAVVPAADGRSLATG